LSERFLSERFIKVIYPVRIDAVFTKQLSQISARRSGGFFVHRDLVLCHLILLGDYPGFVNRLMGSSRDAERLSGIFLPANHAKNANKEITTSYSRLFA